MTYTHHYASPLGGVTLASDGQHLTGLWFDGQKYFGSTLGKTHEPKDLPVFAQAAEWLDLYFSGKDPSFTPPLSLNGTSFQKSVWEILLSIPSSAEYQRTDPPGLCAALVRRRIII